MQVQPAPRAGGGEVELDALAKRVKLLRVSTPLGSPDAYAAPDTDVHDTEAELASLVRVTSESSMPGLTLSEDDSSPAPAPAAAPAPVALPPPVPLVQQRVALDVVPRGEDVPLRPVAAEAPRPLSPGVEAGDGAVASPVFSVAGLDDDIISELDALAVGEGESMVLFMMPAAGVELASWNMGELRDVL